MVEGDQKVLAEESSSDETSTQTAPTVTVATPTTTAAKSKFAGDGVAFRAKLFGTADVNEPRGDAICNTAIGLLKSAVKTTGEHKQKIIIRINFTGITLIDAFNMLRLYEHPVNKISFISKDPTDNRAFGYIVSEANNKHTYFGIKTEKAAEAVVVALRDMFQEVFDLKKKEAEMKGETVDKSTTETPTPAEKKEETPAPTSPKLGDEPDTTKAESKPAEVKRENSSSHLLELLGDLSFSEPTPQAAANTSAQNQPWPPQNAASSSWGNAVPAQNDPFAVQPQQNMFAQQQPAQRPTMQQTSPFSQPFNQPQGQPAFGTQPNQMFNTAGAQPMFGAAPQQQQMFQQPAQQVRFQQPPQGVAASPFAQQPAQFTNDPFATNGFSQSAPQAAAPVQNPNNPFASPPEQAFGVLQPQAMAPPQQAAAAGQPQAQQPGNLFSDLNPLPSGSQHLGKDQFFSDVKNPPKPKLNEMQPQTTQQTQPAANTNPFPIQPMTNTPQNYDWLNQLMTTNQIPASETNVTNQPVGLIAPPPSHVRPRPGQTSLVRPM